MMPLPLVTQAPRVPKPLKRKDDRIILHFDYDCFYASVFENENPSLKSLPLGIKQKSILATCNYVARARGVKKLMLIHDAQKICPDLVLMNGEDLTRFRDVSKKLWLFLRSYSWNKRVERLGLDEVFLDVTDIIAYNQQLLNPNALENSFFQLSEQDPEKGFAFDGTAVFGCVFPENYAKEHASLNNPMYVRLMLASHLAEFLRHKLEEDFRYTSTCGISTNKVLAKLAGSKNKPRNQTTLMSLCEEDVQEFMNAHPIRKIPGMGFKLSHLIQNLVQQTTTEAIPHDDEHSAKITTREVLAYPDISPELLEKTLAGPGSERGIGEKAWNLLHGMDNTEVKEASDVPTQISIEDTYMTKPINLPSELMRELRALSASLVRRLRVDLVEEDPANAESGAQRWLAYPKTLRLSTRIRSRLNADNQPKESFNRSSRSQLLPNFVFSLRDSLESVAERLVDEAVLPLFRRLHHERQGWNLALINICATNMVLAGNDEGSGAGRDISNLFKTQDARLREWTVYDTMPVDTESVDRAEEQKEHNISGQPTVDDGLTSELEVAWEEDGDSHRCAICGHAIPIFAMPAHERFHLMGD